MRHHTAFTMNADFFSLYFPILLTFTPWLFVKLIGKFGFRRQFTASFPYWRHSWLLFLAGFAWAAAIQLWNIPISPDADSITTHLLGGAVVAPALLAYFIRGFGWHWPNSHLKRFILLLTFVTIFGLSNELIETVGTHLGLLKINTSDTWWDLSANTVGAILAYPFVEQFRRK